MSVKDYDFRDVVADSVAFASYVEKHKETYDAENQSVLESLGKDWEVISDSTGSVVRMKNKSGDVFEFNKETRRLTRVISPEEREEIEKKWPKSED